MFEVSISADLSQLLLKSQLRGNKTALMLFKGVDNLQEFISILKKYSENSLYIFNNKKIDKPTYDETQFLATNVKAIKDYSFSNIEQDVSFLFKTLSVENKKRLSSCLYQIIKECIENQCNKSMLQNGYLRVLNTLLVHLNRGFEDDSAEKKILYVGKPDKYDILAFTVLGLYGFDVVICDFNNTVTSDCLCINRFVLVNGVHVDDVDLGFLDYVNKGVKNIENNIVVSNSWVNFKEHTNLESLLKLLNWDIGKRFELKKWKTLNLCLKGVDSVSSYSQYLSDFLVSVKALNRDYYLVNNALMKPTYDENMQYTENYKDRDIVQIFSNYPLFLNSGVIAQVDLAFKEIADSKNYGSSVKLESYMTVLKIWVLRILNQFFTSSSLLNLPLIVWFGDVLKSEKEQDFLKVLTLLPLDIALFVPNFSTLKLDVNSFHILNIGASNTNIKSYPETTGIGKVATMAYNAERDLDTLLYSDTSLFRIKQFKKIRPVVLKTTYEEISILWNETAKVRPSFELVGDLVTTPTIFEKVNGVNATYIKDISKMKGSNVLFYDTFPNFKVSNDKDYKLFIKQIVFKDSIDYKRFITSSHYKYSVYSEETQSLVFEKIEQLIKMDWCSFNDKNINYTILEVLLNLPQNILQLIHNYDFTEDIPKLIYYNGTASPCSIEDCIVLMFLKLIGFDIVVFAPTGYRVIEQYISNQWFNEVTIGEFRFDMENISKLGKFEDDISSKKKSGLFGWLLN